MNKLTRYEFRMAIFDAILALITFAALGYIIGLNI